MGIGIVFLFVCLSFRGFPFLASFYFYFLSNFIFSGAHEHEFSSDLVSRSRDQRVSGSLELVIEYLHRVILHSRAEEHVGHGRRLSKHRRLLPHLIEGEQDILPLSPLQDSTYLQGGEGRGERRGGGGGCKGEGGGGGRGGKRRGEGGKGEGRGKRGGGRGVKGRGEGEKRRGEGGERERGGGKEEGGGG